jgi:PAS domain S-box-containing protein
MPDASSTNHPLLFSLSQQQGAEHLLTEVLTQLDEGVAILAADGTILSWSPRMTSLTGYTAREANARSWEQLFDLSTPCLTMRVEQARGGRATVGERLTLKCANGNHRSVMLWGIPLPQTDGTAPWLLAVLREVSTAALPPAAAHAQDRLLLLAQLAGVVSHEIYNPLNAILLHADILEEELSQPDGVNREQLLHSVEVMKTRVTQVYDLVQEYLVVARLEDLSYTPEDLGALLEAFSLEKRQRLLAHGITLTLRDTAEIGPVPLHKPTFWRALCNVEQYAVEAMPQGGTLTLHGQRCESHIRLDIHHTGTGLSETQISCLSSPASVVNSAGKGLGLSLVREVILAHHGQITITSTPDTGTTITVTLPLYTVEGIPGA